MTNYDSFKAPVVHHFGAPRPALAEAHERTRQKMRAKRLAKLRGKRPSIRWTARKAD